MDDVVLFERACLLNRRHDVQGTFSLRGYILERSSRDVGVQ